ncbi:MAG: site-specific integrase [Nitrososphaera sp.]
MSRQDVQIAANSPISDIRLERAKRGMPMAEQRQLSEGFSPENRTLVVDALLHFEDYDNIKPGTKTVYVNNLLYLCRHLNNKLLSEVNREEILAYLQTLRKSSTEDPDQKWINTHNNRVVIYQKFFKWLYYPEFASRERPMPDVVRDLPLLRRKEKTHVKAKDLWTPEEDAVFVKYCQDKRMQLYHIMSIETSGRPHEILAIRIEDVQIKNTGNKVYAEVEIGRGGKTKSRTVPLIDSLPYYKAWLREHPEPSNQKAFVFRTLDFKGKYQNRPIKTPTLRSIYRNLRNEIFPQLLERQDVPADDKRVIQDMLKRRWNPYTRRHTSITKLAHMLNEHELRQHSGWTKTSQMVEIYTHDLGGESSRAILQARGFIPKPGEADNRLAPVVCPNCKYENKPDAPFCEGCNHVLSYKAYVQQAQLTSDERSRLQKLEEDKDMIERQLAKVLTVISLSAKGIKVSDEEIAAWDRQYSAKTR